MYICLFPGRRLFHVFFHLFFFPKIVAVAKSPSTAQEALQKMRISRQVHLPQLHTPEQITEVLGGVGFVSHENQLDVFFGKRSECEFPQLLLPTSPLTHRVAGIEDILSICICAFKQTKNDCIHTQPASPIYLRLRQKLQAQETPFGTRGFWTHF